MFYVVRNRRGKKTMSFEEFMNKEFPLATALVSFNSNIIISPYAEQTVVKSPEICMRGALYSTNRFLFEYYLLNCNVPKSDLGRDVGVNEYREPEVILSLSNRHLNENILEKEHLIDLPRPLNPKAPISGVIRSRRSIRQYSGESMTLKELSTILYYANGITGELSVVGMHFDSIFREEGSSIKLRSAPSGGGLYPICIYVIPVNVTGLERGVYKYRPYSHKLELISAKFDMNQLKEAIYADIDIEKVNIILVFSYVIYRNARKYGEPSLIYALIETGEISQNVHLIACATGYGSCDIGAYYKNDLEKLLGIDGIFSHIIHVILVGKEQR